MRRYLVFLLAAVCAIGAGAQNGIIHGNGDPRTLHPAPNCASSRFYVDDSTQDMYQANRGSPCVWAPAGDAANLPGVASDGADGIAVAGGFVGQSSQGELNGAKFASPEAAVTAACAGSHAVYFPAGVYSTTGLAVCSGLKIRCSSSDLLGAQGVTFQVTGANWGLFNPNASLTSGTNSVRNLSVTDCNFDISANPSALGAWTTKGISWSSFVGNSITTNNNPNPAITEDGGNYAFNSGDYDNTFIGTNIYNKGTVPRVGTGYLLTGVGGSNSNTHVGGSITRMNTVIDAESANNNIFDGIDAENWYQTGILLTSGAAGNAFRRFRTETNLLPWAANATLVLGQQKVDSNGNMQIVTTAGTTGATVPAWAPDVVDSITTSGGCTIVGTVGQTVLLTSFNNGSSATATGTLTLANTLTGASWVITSAGTGATAAPTSATCSAGTVSSASGTAALTTTVGTVGQTISDGTVTWTLSVIAPTDVIATGSNSNLVDVYISGYETGIVDQTGKNTYTSPQIFGATATNKARNVVMWGANNKAVNIGVGHTPNMADGATLNGNIDATGEVQGSKALLICNSSLGCPDTGGSYTKMTSLATSARAVVFPDQAGTVLLSGNPAAVSSVAIAGGTPMTSQSSANSQIVTCPTGGSSTQYCGADGLWHNALPGGPVASVASSTFSSTSATGFTTFYTTAAAGNYRICAAAVVTVAGTGTGTFQAFFTYTGDGHTFSPALGVTMLVASQWVSNANGGTNNCSVFYADTGTGVRWDFSPVGSVTGAPTIRYSWSLEYLNP